MNRFDKKFHFIVIVTFLMLQFAYFEHELSADHHHDHQQNICQICLNFESFTADIHDVDLAIKSIFLIDSKLNNYQNILLSYNNINQLPIRAPPIFS